MPQDLALRQHAAFFHNLARSGLDTETDGFLVNVESDIVKAVHRVLQVRFLSWRFPRQSQHRSRFESPSSFHLCIHTDGTDPNSPRTFRMAGGRLLGQASRALPTESREVKRGAPLLILFEKW